MMMLILGALLAASPVTSQDMLVSSNGYGSLGYSHAQQRFTRFLQHPYKYESEGVATRNLLFDAYFGARIGAENFWLSELADGKCDPTYENGTNIITCTQAHAGVTFVTRGYAPRGLQGPAYVVSLEVTNTTSSKLPVELFSLFNHRLGSERPIPTAATEYVEFKQGVFVEYGPYQTSAAAVVYAPLPKPSRRTFDGGGGGENPYTLVKSGSDFPALIDAPDGGRNADDAAVGYQWSLSLDAGESQHVAVLVSVDHGNQFDAAFGRAQDFLQDVGAPGLLNRERNVWTNLVAAAPAGLSADEAAVYRQSEAVLLMGQVRESGRAGGQLLAALAPATTEDMDQWNITWVRDMTYAIVALVELGNYAEARAALEFVLQADSGKYVEFVGAPYQVSITRYYGNGTEETDYNEFGPNIEFDGFGSMLWALGRYVDASGDATLLDAYWPVIRTQIADVLVGLIEPYSQLIKADSSIWEVHWNGKQKQYTYTTVTAVAGLCSAAELAEQRGELGLARDYRNNARRIRKAMSEQLFDDEGVLAQSYDDLKAGSGYYDGAVLEAFAMRVMDPTDPRATTTLAKLREKLAIGDGRGIRRNDDGGAYDNREWVFVDLRMAEALRAAGQAAAADTVIAWITAQSRVNDDLIGELYDEALAGPNAAVYRGASPMVGFGAGAYTLALRDKLGLRAPWVACGSYSNEIETSAGVLPVTEPVPPAPEKPAVGQITQVKGSGCQQSSTALPAPWFLLMAAPWAYGMYRDRRRDRS